MRLQVVLEVLLRAHAEGRRFRVIIVDSRPECGGRELLRKLLDANMDCTYTLLSGLSYAIKEVRWRCASGRHRTAC